MNILYLRKYAENVDHLIRNAKLIAGLLYPEFLGVSFQKHHFCRISSFTKGFAATAYPSRSIHAWGHGISRQYMPDKTGCY